MATTFDVNRVGGGTFELVQDPATGRYTVQQVGFTPVKKLSIPDYTTATAGTTDTGEATKKATEEVVKQQTTELFKPATGGDRIDYTGSEMLSQAQLQKEAKKIDPQVDTTTTSLGIARPTIRDVAGETTEQKKDTTPFERPTMRDVAGEELPAKAKAPGIFTDKTTIGSPFGAFDVTPKGVFSRPEYISTTPAAKAAMTSNAAELGISRVESTAMPSATRTAKEADFASGVYEPEKKAEPITETVQTGLKKVKTGLQTLASSVGKVLANGPIMSLAKAAFTETPTQKFDKSYFTDRGDGRIGGNPTTDLYAGFNRVSAFGDLEKAGRDRIATREKTIEKKGYKPGDKFYDDTQNMKDQQRDYQKAKEAKTSSARERARMNQPGSGGNDSGSSNARVICTELHRTKELSTQDWVRDVKFTFNNLSKKHVKGYLSWAVPTVEHIQKYPRYRKVWKHIAQHRANDIAWRMNQGKFDLLGRIYAGIGEPLCWLIGNFVNDKQYEELNRTGKRHI